MINALFPYLRRIRRMRSDIFRAFRFARASLVAALAFLLSLIILSSLLSCSPKRTVVVTLHSDSVAAAHRLLAGSRLSADTVVFRDSVIIDRSRDTISRTFVRWRDRVSVRHDTLRIESHDTIRIRLNASSSGGIEAAQRRRRLRKGVIHGNSDSDLSRHRSGPLPRKVAPEVTIHPFLFEVTLYFRNFACEKFHMMSMVVC